MNDIQYNESRAEIGEMRVNLASLHGPAIVVYVSTPIPGYDIASQGKTVFLPEDRLIQTANGTLEEAPSRADLGGKVVLARLRDLHKVAPDASEALEEALDQSL